MSSGLEIGDIVQSTAGRDRDVHYMVVDVHSSGRVFLADGEVRTLRRPKIKSERHVRRLRKPQRLALVSRLRAGRAADSEILAELRGYIHGEGCSSRKHRKLIADMIPFLEEEAG
ncbi:MAG: hypothetical protein R6U70_01405 [Bacillota bacterium]